MELKHCLQLIPKDCLRRGLRDNEETVLRRVSGDVIHAQLLYRLCCRWLLTQGTFPTYEDLPERMREKGAVRCGMQRKFKWGAVDPWQLHRICRRTLKLLERAAELHIGLDWLATPVKAERLAAMNEDRESHRCEMCRHEFVGSGELCPECSPTHRQSGFVGVLHSIGASRAIDDTPEARSPFVEIYRKQAATIERRYHVTKEGDRDKPTPMPVLCVEMQRLFKSTRAAADFLTHLNCKLVRRSDIRTAIRKNHKCGTWIPPVDVDLARCADDGMAGDTEPQPTHLTWRYVDAPVVAQQLVAA